MSARMGTRIAAGLMLALGATLLGGGVVSAARASAPAPRTAALAPRLTIARLQYDGGGDWYANPSSLPNLLAAIRERTTLRAERTEAHVRLTDDRLWDYPYLHLTGHGDDQVQRRGGGAPARVPPARRLPARRRQLRPRRELPARRSRACSRIARSSRCR